ncbi:hypothetical protein [Frigoribacterium sp. PhB24]|uniref:hypothetical protein n=1 Tax=Frigoribacterium sp. PhB24 TaxID=2485204 RepID=UPI000F4883FD|nr:hypothetical protein [Frigoribacterium sp. PhB24]ROS49009.1 hypothetical protein EDF50_2798 [Frigoribacterium sp. PhB24]
MITPCKTAAIAILTSSLALLVSFAALLYQGGIIADETGGVGHLYPVEQAIGWVGTIGTITAIALFVIDTIRHSRRTQQHRVQPPTGSA